ncbi:threalose-6-phosphate phosphatase [Actinomortierella ambigua]|nr:threalose-6-phosphate phosphatase [Actinomortierella ambigua]
MAPSSTPSKEMSSVATFHSSSSTHSLSVPKVVSLAELPETAQIVLSEKPRLINVTHQIPYTVTLIERISPGGLSSPSNRRTSYISSPRHASVDESASAAPLACEEAKSHTNNHPSTQTPNLDANGSKASAKGSSNGAGAPTLVLPGHPDGDLILETRRGHSALYSGIKSLEKDLETIQIGWVGELADQDGYVIPSKCLTDSHKAAIKQKLWQKEKVVPIFLEDARAAGHYEGYCKSVLWPLFHYLLWDEATDGRIEKKNWDDYVFVNQQFADAIVQQYQPGDIERVEVLNGMLGANQIGFQTYSYARHFISCCTRVNGYESTPRGVDAQGSTVWVGTFPIGIDAERVERQRKAPGVLPKMKAIRETYAGKRIIVGRDKLDLVKGVQQKLLAFEKFLKDYPERHGQVVLIQVTSPPLVENPKLEAKIAELVAHINGTYGSLNFTPVHHYHQHIDRDEYYALLSVADIGLITSVRDGMNTTSLEYIMCQSEHHGPLILSEFTGTAGSLGGALMVNPWDYQGVAKVINDALNLSEQDKRTRHNQLLKHVLAHTAQFWAKSFISELILNVGTWDQSTPTPYLDLGVIAEKYHTAKKRLLMFDYDGTLTPIRKTPGAAVPQEHMLKALTALVADPKNIVWVISGRDQKVLEEWLGSVGDIGFSAEHGSFMRQPGSKKWANLTESLDMGWKNDVIEIFTYYTERTQGSFIEHKRSSLTWHYRMADPEFGAFQAKECQNHLENAVLSKLPVEILVGKKNLEVRPTIVNKGEIVKRLLAQHPDVEFVLCAGDDKTDEDMFRALATSKNAALNSTTTSTGNTNNNNNNTNTNTNAFSLQDSRSSTPTAAELYTEDLIATTAAKLAQATFEQSAKLGGHHLHDHHHGLDHHHHREHANGNGSDSSSSSSSGNTSETASTAVSSALSGTPSTAATLVAIGNQVHATSPGGTTYFSITIGHALKKTLANWHVTSPEELIRVLGILSGTIDS